MVSDAPASVTKTTTNSAPGRSQQAWRTRTPTPAAIPAADDRPADQAEHRQPGVHPDQVDTRRHHPRRHRAAQHREGLGQHHHPQRARIEHPRRVAAGGGVVVHDQHHRQHGAQQERRRQRRAPAVLQPVQGRTDQRSDHRERGDGDQQVQRDLALALAGRRREEQRVGQRDRHRRVDGEVGDHRPGQRRQTGLVGAVGGGGAVHHRVHPRPHLGGGPGDAGGRSAPPCPRSRRRCRGRRCAGHRPVAADSGWRCVANRRSVAAAAGGAAHRNGSCAPRWDSSPCPGCSRRGGPWRPMRRDPGRRGYAAVQTRCRLSPIRRGHAGSGPVWLSVVTVRQDCPRWTA